MGDNPINPRMNPMRGYGNNQGGFGGHQNRAYNPQYGQNFNNNRFHNQGHQGHH